MPGGVNAEGCSFSGDGGSVVGPIEFRGKLIGNARETQFKQRFATKSLVQ